MDVGLGNRKSLLALFVISVLILVGCSTLPIPGGVEEATDSPSEPPAIGKSPSDTTVTIESLFDLVPSGADDLTYANLESLDDENLDELLNQMHLLMLYLMYLMHQ